MSVAVSDGIRGPLMVGRPQSSNPLWEPLGTLCEQIDTARMMSDLAQLATWPKLAATPSELESLRHLRSWYDTAGFATEIIWHDAYISIPGPSRLIRNGQSIAAITHSMARPTPIGGLSAQRTLQ